MKRLIVICGMHRSGTSMMAQLIQSMGAYLGEEDALSAAGADNRDGFFEHVEIVRLDNEILHLCRREWYSLEAPEPDIADPRIAKAMEGIGAVLRKLFEIRDVVAVKDPRISLLLPLWEKTIDGLGVEVKYVWAFRNPLEVMESLWKRDGFSSRHSLLLWTRYHLSILKAIQGKDYLAVHYRDILENPSMLERVGQFLGLPYDDILREEWRRIIKPGYCHSDFSFQDIGDRGLGLLTDFYGALLEHREADVDAAEWDKCYREFVPRVEDCFIDYEVLEDTGCLKEKEIVIYGAGLYGSRASEMLRELGYPDHQFCDKDIRRHGTDFMGRKVLSMKDVEKKENLLLVIAVGNNDAREMVGQTLACIAGAGLLSFFALEKAWKYATSDAEGSGAMADAVYYWCRGLSCGAGMVRDACASPVLIYQYGKVGSKTVHFSLEKAGIRNAHIHRFFGKPQCGMGTVPDSWQKKFCGIPYFDSAEHRERIRREMKGRKIITMVRDPVAVNLSRIFENFGAGLADLYFIEQMGQGNSFRQAVVRLMLRAQNFLFDWFDEELKELCGIDVFAHPFDREKGYAIIRENDVEVLLIKTEKLSGLAEVIGDFVGIRHFELVDDNVGAEKEYAHIYRKTKENLVLPKEYVDFYYEGNPRMNHFYSEAEREALKRKWRRD